MTEFSPSEPLTLVLASTSPYRRAQMQQILLKFECDSPAVDESPLHHEPPGDLASRLALAKAQKVANLRHKNTVIVAGDQCAALGNTLLGKPGSATRAAQQLLSCQGKNVDFHSGLCVIDNRTSRIYSACIKTTVKFRHLEKNEIEGYVIKDKPWDCAGGFKFERLGIALFESVSSEDPSALMGLPLIALTGFLRVAGINPLLPPHLPGSKTPRL